MGKKKPQTRDEVQHVKCPIEMARCGRGLSSSAIRVYLVIASYNPSYPGLRRIGREAGLSTSTVHVALKELLKRQVIHRDSGKLDYKSNEYRIFAPKDWKLPKEGSKPKKKRKTASINETPPPENRLGKRGTGASINEAGGASINEDELDQYKIDQLIISGAPRYLPLPTSEGGVEGKSSEGEQEKGVLPDRIKKPGMKGVAPKGDDIPTEYRRQYQELFKAMNAGAITGTEYRERVTSLRTQFELPTFFAEPVLKNGKEKPVGKGGDEQISCPN